MKKLFLVLTVALSTALTAQVKPFLGVDLQTTNANDFKETAKLSLEVGLEKEHSRLGVVVGRHNLKDLGNETWDKYYYEGKVSLLQDFGFVKGVVFGGVGSYFNDPKVFIEYGAGVEKDLTEHLAIVAQLSNWDGNNFLGTGIKFKL